MSLSNWQIGNNLCVGLMGSVANFNSATGAILINGTNQPPLSAPSSGAYLYSSGSQLQCWPAAYGEPFNIIPGGGGSQLARISTTTNAVTAITSGAGQVAVSGMNLTISPVLVSSNVLITCNFLVGFTGSNTGPSFSRYTLYRNGSDLNVQAGVGFAQVATNVVSVPSSLYIAPVVPVTISYLDSPATTSPVTYQLYGTTSYTPALLVNESATSPGTMTMSCVEV
jgi:hypothetical protein